MCIAGEYFDSSPFALAYVWLAFFTWMLMMLDWWKKVPHIVLAQFLYELGANLFLAVFFAWVLGPIQLLGVFRKLIPKTSQEYAARLNKVYLSFGNIKLK